MSVAKPQSSTPDLTSSANALAGGIASTLATVITYPFDLIRTRFQGTPHQRFSFPCYDSNPTRPFTTANPTEKSTTARGRICLTTAPQSALYDTSWHTKVSEVRSTAK